MSGFKDVVGHKDIIQYIQNAVEQDKVSHAYILNGAKGSGKKMLAKLFAMTLQCENSQSEPCGECRSCRQADSGNQPDIITIQHEKPGSISVDDIREQLNGDIMIKAYSNRYKIYIIPEADLLTVQAQNALLKTIEEPPEYAIIFLLTENADSLLPTIRSRCVMLKLRNIKDTLIKKYLMEQLHIPDYQADICAAFAQGNMGRAIMLATSEHFNEIKEEAVQLLKYIDEMELNEIVSAIKEINKYKLEKGNAESYNKIRTYYNSLPKEKRDPRLFLAVIMYGYQQQIRFNGNHEFNNPVGMRWFNDKVLEKLISFSRHIKEKDYVFESKDYIDIIETMSYESDDFIYFDPPYKMTTGSYNDGKRGFKGWNNYLEKELFQVIDNLTERNIKCMLSYVLEHNGKFNNELNEWINSNGYKLIELGDVLGISGSRRKEVLVINYDI